MDNWDWLHWSSSHKGSTDAYRSRLRMQIQSLDYTKLNWFICYCDLLASNVESIGTKIIQTE